MAGRRIGYDMKSKSSPKQSNKWNTRLRSVLREKNITLRKAAQLAGVANSVVDSWSSGASPADLQAVKRLCDALDLSFTWLLTGEHEKTERKPTLAELYQEIPYFDGLARIRIDRLVPNKAAKDDGDSEDK